jgi:MFS family permease
VGKGLRTAPRDALIADSVSESVSGKAFGIHRTLDQMGAVVGPVAAFALLQFVDIRGMFLFSLLPGAVAVVILILLVKEVAIKRRASSTLLSNIGAAIKGNGAFVMILVIGSCFFASNVLFGYLWDNYNLVLATIYSMILTIAAISGMLAFLRRYN